MSFVPPSPVCRRARRAGSTPGGECPAGSVTSPPACPRRRPRRSPRTPAWSRGEEPQRLEVGAGRPHEAQPVRFGAGDGSFVSEDAARPQLLESQRGHDAGYRVRASPGPRNRAGRGTGELPSSVSSTPESLHSARVRRRPGVAVVGLRVGLQLLGPGSGGRCCCGCERRQAIPLVRAR